MENMDARIKARMVDLPPEVQKVIMANIEAARRRVAKHIFTGAPILWVLAVGLVFGAILHGGFSAAKRRFVERAVRSPGMQAIEREADILGAEFPIPA